MIRKTNRRLAGCGAPRHRPALACAEGLSQSSDYRARHRHICGLRCDPLHSAVPCWPKRAFLRLRRHRNSAGILSAEKPSQSWSSAGREWTQAWKPALSTGPRPLATTRHNAGQMPPSRGSQPSPSVLPYVESRPGHQESRHLSVALGVVNGPGFRPCPRQNRNRRGSAKACRPPPARAGPRGTPRPAGQRIPRAFSQGRAARQRGGRRTSYRPLIPSIGLSLSARRLLAPLH